MKVKKKQIPWGAQTLKMPVKQKRVLSVPQTLPPETSLTERFEFFCPTSEADPEFNDDFNRVAFSLMTEKPLYQGGERVEVMVYAYDKYSKRPFLPNEQKVILEKVTITLTDEHGIQVEQLKPDLDRTVGVVRASHILKRNCEGGLLRLEMRYFGSVVDKTKFYVMRLNERRNAVALDLDRDNMSVGEELKGKVTLKMFNRMEDFFRTGGLGERISYTVLVFDQDFEQIASFSRELSHGKGFFSYMLPESAREKSSLFVVVELEFDREKLEITREVLINKLNAMHVKFVAGGGRFVLGCQNDIFFGAFTSKTMVDQMSFKGAQLVEKSEAEEKVLIASVESNEDGRGIFSLQIKEECQYFLRLTQGSSTRSFWIVNENDTFEYAPQKFTTVQMKIKERVYGWGDSIKVHIEKNKFSDFEKFRLVLVDKLRLLHEAVVSFPSGYNKGNMKIDLRAIPSLSNGGVLSVQLYDFFDTAEPLQECLVFVYPSKKLNLQMKFDKKKYSPGDLVNFEVDLGDREGLVGVVVSDETPFLDLERRDLPASLCTKVFLEKELYSPDEDFNDNVKYIDWFFENNEFIAQQLLESGGVSPDNGLKGYKENKREQLSILLGLQDWRLFFLNEKSIRAFVQKPGWDAWLDPLKYLMGLSVDKVDNIFHPKAKFLQMVCNDHGVRHGVFKCKRKSDNCQRTSRSRWRPSPFPRPSQKSSTSPGPSSTPQGRASRSSP